MLVGHSCLFYVHWVASKVDRLGVLRFRVTATLQSLGLITLGIMFHSEEALRIAL